ncbi:hypothetical protein P1X16_27620 [Hymenobacter sp. YC55]|nr:hypothetical protein [Hymenobacter sp. YC55]
MELNALSLFLTSTPQALSLLPGFISLDGSLISHSDGTAALRQGQAVLVGDLLTRALGAQPQPLPIAA